MRLLILGMLIEKPMHGYDIKKTMEERMGDFTDYQFGSIYFALKKLTEEGFTQLLERDNDAEGMPKKTYEITDKGREEFIRLLELRFSKFQRIYYSFDEGLYFAKYLQEAHVIKYIDIQLLHAQKAIKYLTKHIENIEGIDSQEETKSFNAKLIIDHTLQHMITEKVWLEKVRKYYVGEERDDD